jgi:hypothetical protein
MANNSKISHRGTLEASIEMGINLTAVFSEFVDNALDAHATEIMIYVPHVPDDVQTILEIYDNGHGMDRETLNKAVSINMRTPATNEKQGCKGAGMTNALAILTQLKSPAMIVSKRSDSSFILRNSDARASHRSERCSPEKLPIPMLVPRIVPSSGIATIVDIDIDYPDYMKNDNYNPTSARKLMSGSEELWNKRIRDELKSEHGTVMSIPSDDSKVSELLEAILSGEIHTNILYDFGIKYYKYMVNNPAIRIGFKVGTSATRFVRPIDPLFMSGLDAKHKKTYNCKLYIHKTSKKPKTRTYLEIDGKMGYTKNTKTNSDHTIEDLPAENSDWQHVSDFPIESAYSKDLMKEIDDIVQSIIENGQPPKKKSEQLTAKQIAQKDTTNAQQKVDYGNGLYINRSVKTITNVKLKQQRGGDFAKQKIYNNSRYRLTYPQIEMDKHMDTQLNKSALQYDNVDMSIRNAVSVIREDFTKKQIALAAAPKPAVVVVPRPNPPVLPPATPAPGAIAPRVQTPNIIATLLPAASSASSNNPVAATRPSSGVLANTIAQPQPLTITIPTQVRQHPRTTVSKKQAIEMIEKLNTVSYIRVSGKYTELLINVLCLTNGKGGDAQLTRQFMGLSKGNTALLSEQVMETYNSKYSDNELVSGGTDIVAFYREHFPENVIQPEAVANL